MSYSMLCILLGLLPMAAIFFYSVGFHQGARTSRRLRDDLFRRGFSAGLDAARLQFTSIVAKHGPIRGASEFYRWPDRPVRYCYVELAEP